MIFINNKLYAAETVGKFVLFSQDFHKLQNLFPQNIRPVCMH